VCYRGIAARPLVISIEMSPQRAIDQCEIRHDLSAIERDVGTVA
jgi:hypothetical protein